MKVEVEPVIIRLLGKYFKTARKGLDKLKI